MRARVASPRARLTAEPVAAATARKPISVANLDEFRAGPRRNFTRFEEDAGRDANLDELQLSARLSARPQVAKIR
jgi:hypothetical protein